MGSELSARKIIEISEMLRQDHDEIRRELSLAAAEVGPLAQAAKRLAQLCIPHFEMEERCLLPALAKLHELVSREELGRESEDVVQEIIRFRIQHKRAASEHESIASAIDVLLEHACRSGNQQATELAHILRNHEKIEDDLDLAACEIMHLAKNSIHANSQI